MYNNVLALNNAVLPLHTASFLDGNSPRPAIALSAVVSLELEDRDVVFQGYDLRQAECRRSRLLHDSLFRKKPICLSQFCVYMFQPAQLRPTGSV